MSEDLSSPSIGSSRRSTPDSSPLAATPNGRASIMILGAPKTGKSTLAVIAAAAFDMRLVEFCAFFQQQTGFSRRDFEKNVGVAEFEFQELSLMQELLLAGDKDHILVCPTLNLQPATQQLIQEFSQSHSVIHINGNLRHGTPLKISTAISRLGQSVSSYEYYNLFEGHSVSLVPNGSTNGMEQPTSTHSFGHSFLRLKRVQLDFLRFLWSVVISPRHCPIDRQRHDNYPPLARTPFTYALSLTLADLLQYPNLEGLLCDGADAVEIKIDLDGNGLHDNSDSLEIPECISRAFSAVRRTFNGPILLHVQKLETNRIAEDKQVQQERHLEYLDLLYHGLRLCPDYLTVDLSCSDGMIHNVIASRGPTRIIGHYHDDSPEPDAWNNTGRMEMYLRARSLGCNMVRLTQVARSMVDNFGSQQFIHRAQGSDHCQYDLIAYNTGPLGRTSCCFNQIYSPVAPTSSLTMEKSSQQAILQPSLTLKEAQACLYASFLLNKLHFYVIGTDVSSSLAPPLYRTGFDHLGMPHTFVPKSMATIDGLKELIADDHFGGATIAQGLKVEAFSYLQCISHHAKMIGAVNTLIPIRERWERGEMPSLRFWRRRNRSGPVRGIYGDNIDWIGVYRSIAKRLSPVNAVSSRTTGLVVGAGGMARAAVYAMIQLGVRHIFIYNRTVAKAYSLAEHYNSQTTGTGSPADEPLPNSKPSVSSRRLPASCKIHVIESLEQQWPESYAQPTMIVCCIRAPVELNAPQPEITIPPQWLRSLNGGVVIDTCYEPLLSPLIRQIRQISSKGWIAVDGLQLLPEHAVAQFELFTGRRVPHMRMCISVCEYYRERSMIDPETSEFIESRLRELYSKLGRQPASVQ